MDMETVERRFVLRLLLLFHISAAFLFTSVLGQSRRTSVVVAVHNITVPAGSQMVLQCHSPRMVWSRDRRKDRQRVVHWDLFRTEPDYSVERLVDKFSAGDQRIYNGFNKGRITLSKTAFTNGNFSLTIKDVGMNDRGTYTCNLHHHYCNLQESMKIQLNVTKSPRKQKRFWDGEKTVFVVLLGSTVVLPCVNRRPVWTDQTLEEEQQVAHWDWQPPGVRRDGADRLIDLYASGERQEYGPLFLRRKMNISDEAFTKGDFSLTVSDLQPPDQGLYSCHLHHHYCGLHERRVYRVSVGPPLPPGPPLTPEPPSELPLDMPHDEPSTDMLEVPHVINVILPENRSHFLQQLGYILVTLLLLVLIAVAIILLTRRCKSKGSEYDMPRSPRGNMSTSDFEMDATELRMCNAEEMKLDYKNNIMKEKAEMCKLQYPKAFNADKGNRAWK
ncbi:matrix remodeling-associated protein 8-like [Megalops cyprinoides]|uniref:matrix remodeling-associated protein 8-like n=1 Tax=Megalops cyprinoides TaxID=118141 RepID=UPI001863BC74|nr:matrix remodeling-associated protein 8-like [Megalops cyprinoides]